MTKDEFINQIESTAKYARLAGHAVSINRSLELIVVYLGLDDYDHPIEYVFRHSEMDDLLNEVPEYVNEEDYILWSAQGW